VSREKDRGDDELFLCVYLDLEDWKYKSDNELLEWIQKNLGDSESMRDATVNPKGKYIRIDIPVVSKDVRKKLK